MCTSKTAFESKTLLPSLVKFKDGIPKNFCPRIVYKFLCSCCIATYYGRTEGHLSVHSSEHLDYTPLIGKRIKYPKEFAIMTILY